MPRNGLIAALGEGGVYLVDPRSSAKHLVPGTASADDYQWSPDGQTLVFDTGDADDGSWTDSDVYAVRADGTQLHRVIRDAWSPSWLPDSSGLLVMREIATDVKFPGLPTFEAWNVATYATRADGSDPRNLTGFDESGDDAFAVSPDGKWVAYSSFGVNRVRLDGSGRKRLTGEQPVLDLTWSPDGRWLAFVTDEDNYLVRPDGSDLRGFGRAGDPFGRLAWSPDGSTIAAERLLDEPPWAEIALVDVDTGSERSLTRRSIASLAPAWSPDGKQIVFVGSAGWWKCDSDDLGDLWVANSDGSGVRRLAKGCWGRPSWLPTAPAQTAPAPAPGGAAG